MKCLALLAALCLATLWVPRADASGAMRCGSRIVSEGMQAAEVLGRCGEPAYRDVLSDAGRGGRGWISDQEQWYYNFGPSQLLRVVTLRNGTVDSIGEDGYGYAETPDGHCAPEEIRAGLSKLRLLLRCGEPLTRRAEGLLRPLNPNLVYRSDLRAYGPDTAVGEVYREEWVYNFGSSHFLRVVTLENGRVVDVANGDRGFD
jgi:hypothetical protein